MDDAAQKLSSGVPPPPNTQQPQAFSQAQDQSLPSQAQQQENISLPIPHASVSSGLKEAEPVVHPEPVPVQTEVLTPSEQEPTLHEEVKEAGVEKVSQHPELTPEDKKAGLEASKEATPVVTQPSGAVKLPMTAQEAENAVKHYSITDSAKWLGKLILMVLSKPKR